MSLSKSSTASKLEAQKSFEEDAVEATLLPRIPTYIELQEQLVHRDQQLASTETDLLVVMQDLKDSRRQLAEKDLLLTKHQENAAALEDEVRRCKQLVREMVIQIVKGTAIAPEVDRARALELLEGTDTIGIQWTDSGRASSATAATQVRGEDARTSGTASSATAATRVRSCSPPARRRSCSAGGRGPRGARVRPPDLPVELHDGHWCEATRYAFSSAWALDRLRSPTAHVMRYCCIQMVPEWNSPRELIWIGIKTVLMETDLERSLIGSLRPDQLDHTSQSTQGFTAHITLGYGATKDDNHWRQFDFGTYQKGKCSELRFIKELVNDNMEGRIMQWPVEYWQTKDRVVAQIPNSRGRASTMQDVCSHALTELRAIFNLAEPRGHGYQYQDRRNYHLAIDNKILRLQASPLP